MLLHHVLKCYLIEYLLHFGWEVDFPMYLAFSWKCNIFKSYVPCLVLGVISKRLSAAKRKFASFLSWSPVYFV